MAQAESVTELHGILQSARLIAPSSDEEDDFIENAMLRLRNVWSKRDLRNSQYPPVVLQAYMTQM